MGEGTYFRLTMKKMIPYAGVILIILGTIVLLCTRFKALNDSNSLLLAGLLLIVVGILLHVRIIKHGGNY